MKKFLLFCMLCLLGALALRAEKFNYGDEWYSYVSSPGSQSPIDGVRLYILTDSTAAVSYDRPSATLTIPYKLDAMEVGHRPDGIVDISCHTYKIVQVNAVDASNVIIPSTVQTIAPGAFKGSSVKSITFAEGETVLELYPCCDSSRKIDTVEINRSIKAVPYLQTDFNFTGGIHFGKVGTLKIGADVGSIEGQLFYDGKNNSMAIESFYCDKVEFANWGNWYNNTMLDCIEANPYRLGAKIIAGGFEITTVPINDGMTEIPGYKNAGLKFDGEIIFPSSLKKIGAYAFCNQKDLYYVEFPEGLKEIGDHAFDGCETLTFESFPESLDTIGIGAFANCKSQKSIILPEKLKTLGYGAFCNMTALEQAVMFCDIDSVPGALCYECKNLNKLYLPKGTTVIGADAFYGTTALEEVILPEGLETICNGAFGRTYSNATPSRINKINFPTSLKKIGMYAFEGQDLRSVSLNEGLEELGECAFKGNYNLYVLTLPSTLKTIPDGAFSGNGMSKLTIPDNITELGAGAFGNSYLGGVVEVGNGITAIPADCFGYPAVLKLGSGVKTFATDAIKYENLKVFELNCKTPPSVSEAFPLTAEQAEQITLIIPDGTKATYQRNPRWNIFDLVERSASDVTVHVSEAPISEEVRLQSGVAPSRVVKMKVTGTLADTDWRLIRENFASLVSLDLSGITNTEIPALALQNMSQLAELILPSKLVTIGDAAFENNNLMDIPALPESLEEIGTFAFKNCRMLSISILPDALKSIKSGAFTDCVSLRAITAGENVVFNDESLQQFTFENCSGLEFVDLSKTKMKVVGVGAFKGCTNLSTVLLPETLTTIGEDAFSNAALQSIDIPATVNEIGSGAFYGTRLRTVNIPEGVQNIPGGTFAYCNKLVSVNFPSSMTSIGAGVFSGAGKVAGISCSAIEAPDAETGALEALNYKRCSLTVPQQSYRSYLNAPQWGRLASNLLNRIVVEIPEEVEVTVIDEQEFQTIVQEEEWLREAESSVEDEKELPVTFKARNVVRAATADGSNYARLFNGAQLATPTTDKGTRVFINPQAGYVLKNVLYNNVDMTSQMEGNSIVLPGAATGNLRIVGSLSGLDDVVTEGVEISTCNAYDTMGRLVFSGERSRLESSVIPGLYIVKSGSKIEKVLVR